MEDQRRRGWALAALGMLLVSTDSLFIRLAETSAWDVAFLVAVLSFPLQLAMAARFDADSPLVELRRDPWPLIAIAALAATSQTAFIGAVNRTEVANVVTIVAGAPIVAALIAWLVFGERTSGRVWTAIAITTSGIAVVVFGSLGGPSLDGDILALVAIVSFATTINLWRRYSQISVFVGLALSALIMALVSVWFASPFSLDSRAYLAIAAMGLVFNPLGRVAHSWAPRYAPASEVALFTPVETVAATAWAWLAFNEVPDAQTMLGAVIVIAGVIFGTVATNADTTRAQRSLS